jgi:hypothetical protein
MEQRGITFSVASLLGLVACAAVNLWCFRVHVMLGVAVLYISKHVVIAQLCMALGVNRRPASTVAPVLPPTPPAGVPSS